MQHVLTSPLLLKVGQGYLSGNLQGSSRHLRTHPARSWKPTLRWTFQVHEVTWGEPPPRSSQPTFQSPVGDLPQPEGWPVDPPEGRLSQPPRFAVPERAGLGKGWVPRPSRSDTSRLAFRPFQVSPGLQGVFTNLPGRPPLGWLSDPSRFPPAQAPNRLQDQGVCPSLNL